MRLLKLTLPALTILLATPIFAEETAANAMKSLRVELRADKRQLVAANLQLTEARQKAKEVIEEAKAGAKKVRGAVEVGLEAAKQELSKGPKKDETKA